MLDIGVCPIVTTAPILEQSPDCLMSPHMGKPSDMCRYIRLTHVWKHAAERLVPLALQISLARVDARC